MVRTRITPAAEVYSDGPTSVLVLPANATGNYELIVESSGYMVTWNAFASTAVTYKDTAVVS